jgi:recombination protein RecA
VSATGELIDLGVEAGLIEKSGAWLSVAGERLGNGREAASQSLASRPELMARLRADLLARAGIHTQASGETVKGTATAKAAETPKGRRAA